MTGEHPTHPLDTPFPPDERDVYGSITLQLAGGYRDLDDIVTHLRDTAADGLDAAFATGPLDLRPEDCDAVVAEVLAAYDRAVPEPTPDAAAMLAALDEVMADGVLPSWGRGWDGDEAATAGVIGVREHPDRVDSFLYCTTQDLDGMVRYGGMYLGFSGVALKRRFRTTTRDRRELGESLARVLRAHGLAVRWDGDPAGRLYVEGLRFAAPYVDGQAPMTRFLRERGVEPPCPW